MATGSCITLLEGRRSRNRRRSRRSIPTRTACPKVGPSTRPAHRLPTLDFNLWAVRFDPERGTPVDPPFALTHFDSQSLVISPEMTQSDMDVSSGYIVLTMKTVTGSIWMLDNVDK